MPAHSRKSRHTLLLLGLTLLFIPTAATVLTAGPWEQLAGIIKQLLNPGTRPVAQLNLVQGQTAIITLYNPLPIGTTLAVKGNSLPGVPLALQDSIARIKLTQVAGNQARGTILPGSRPVPPRAPLFPEGHNRVYLYTNLAAPQVLQPYQDLVRTLQYNRIVFANKSARQLAAGDIPGIRPLIITLEAAGNQLFCKLTDREQNIFFQNSFRLAFTPPVIAPPGQARATASNGFGTIPGGAISKSRSFTQASGPAPGTTPIGRIKLKNGYKRLVFTEFDGNPGDELALLNKKWLEIYRMQGLKLEPVSRFRIPYREIIPIHLDAGDFNHNGRDELYLTLGRPLLTDNKLDTELASIIVEGSGRSTKLLGKNYPYYFRVIEIRDGRRVLMVQRMGEFKQYQTPIRWAGFYQGRFAVRSEFKQARDVFSLYNFNLNPFNRNQILVLDEEGNLAGFNAKTSEAIAYCNNAYGVFDETPYYQKLKDIVYEGGFTITQTAATRYAPRRFIKRNSYGKQIFLIKKQREVNPDLKSQALALFKKEKVKADQIIGIQWRGEDIIESWKSPRFPRDVIDFGFTRINSQETMVVLTRDQKGRYALELLH